MNAIAARTKALKNIEILLWEKLHERIRIAIIEAVHAELLVVEVPIEGLNIAEDGKNLDLLGYEWYHNKNTLFIDW